MSDDTDDDRPTRHRPPKYTKKRARESRQLASVFQAGMPPEVLRDFLYAILAGNDPKIVEDENPHTGELVYSVLIDERGGIAPTLAQKVAVVQLIMDRGWGLSVQSVVLAAQLRIEAASVPELAPGSLPARDVEQMLAILDRRKTAALPPARPPIDVEATEPTSAERAPAITTEPDPDDKPE